MLDRVAGRVSEGVQAWRSASLTPLQTPLFRWLWLAAMASNFGAVMQMAGASWAMTTLAPSPHIVALVHTAALGPIMLLALPAGALADTTDRRLLMLASQVLGLVGTLALIVLHYSGAITPWLLLTNTALVGAAVALYTPAWQASFADIVPRRALPAAVGLNAMAYNVARSLGPAVGGFVIAVAGVGATFVINAISFLGLIAVLATNKFPRTLSSLPPEPVGQAMIAGLRYMVMSPALKSIFLRSAVFGLGGSAVWSLAPLITQQRLDGGSIAYGLMLGGFGLGSLLAALVTAYLRGLLGNERLFSAATLGFALATCAIGLTTWLPLSLLCMTVAGACWIFSFTTTTTCIQYCAPRWVVGRAVSLSQIAAVGSIAFGASFWGYLAEHTSLVIAFVSAGALLAASLLMTFVLPLPGREFEDLSPRPTVDIPAPRVQVQANTGPVFVTLAYKVEPVQLDEFLATMYALGQVRKRDGARRWAIQQDLDDPTIWLEVIESATWGALLRRANRGTVADETLRIKAEGFRIPGPAGVRRTVERPPGATPLSSPAAPPDAR